MKILLLLLLAALWGCSLQDSEVREYNRGMSKENWYNCSQAYKEANKPTISRHIHLRGWKHGINEVREDLVDNKCRQILGDAWANAL